MTINEFKAKWPKYALHIYTPESGGIRITAISDVRRDPSSVEIEGKRSLEWMLRGIDAALSTPELEKPRIGPRPERFLDPDAKELRLVVPISGLAGIEWRAPLEALIAVLKGEGFLSDEDSEDVNCIKKALREHMLCPNLEEAWRNGAFEIRETGRVDLTEQPMEFRTFHKRTKHKVVQIDMDFSIHGPCGTAYGNAGDWLCENEAGGARWIVRQDDFEKRYIGVAEC